MSNLSISSRPDSAGGPLRRRRRTADRCEPIPETGMRDPHFDRFNPDRREPSDFGLTISELRAEITRCQRAGWQPWELRERFRNPTDVQRELDEAAEADRIIHETEATYV